jgi:hypothetical protein
MKYTHLIKLEVTVSILGDSRNRNGILRLASLLEVAPLLQRLKLNVSICVPLVNVSCIIFFQTNSVRLMIVAFDFS